MTMGERAKASIRGRGRLSAFNLLPPECEGLIAWAAQELAAMARTQTDIYAEFVTQCLALQAEHRGELEFAIPSFSAFNRQSIRLARMTKRLDQTRAMVATLAEKFDAKASDDLTILTADTIKSLVFTLVGEADDRIDLKDVMHMASALRQAAQAQNISSDRRRKMEEEFAVKVTDAVDKVGKVNGMSAETLERIKAEILGVTA